MTHTCAWVSVMVGIWLRRMYSMASFSLSKIVSMTLGHGMTPESHLSCLRLKSWVLLNLAQQRIVGRMCAKPTSLDAVATAVISTASMWDLAFHISIQVSSASPLSNSTLCADLATHSPEMLSRGSHGTEKR